MTLAEFRIATASLPGDVELKQYIVMNEYDVLGDVDIQEINGYEIILE